MEETSFADGLLRSPIACHSQSLLNDAFASSNRRLECSGRTIEERGAHFNKSFAQTPAVKGFSAACGMTQARPL